jgi:hypothetical protein
LTIGFFSKDYSIGDATGLLKTLNVFRVYGAAVNGVVKTGTGITTINGMTNANAGPTT